MSTFAENFVSDVARGVSSKSMRQMHVPQARWMQIDNMMTSRALTYNTGDPGARILVGQLADKLVGIEDNRHVLTVAGSRAGKSVTLINNLLFYRGSVLALDPKGELAAMTAERRAALGQKVCIVDPFQIVPERLARFRKSFNPLGFLDAKSDTIIEDAGLLADAMVVSSEGGEKDPHWNDSAQSIIEGLLLYIATAPQFEERRDLMSLAQLMRMILQKRGGSEEFVLETALLNHAAQLGRREDMSHVGEAIGGAAASLYEKPANERGGVVSTARRHVKFLESRALQRVLGGNDFELSELKTAPEGMTVYLCLPATRMNVCNRWLRMFVNLLLNAMERTPVPQTGTGASRPPVLVCLDEFPVLGRMKQLEDAAGQIASFGVKLWVIIQDWGQGKSLYKDRWETFVGNAGILQFFGNNDLMTTEYISKKLGRTVVMVTRENEVSAEQRNAGVSGRSESLEQFDLLTPDEVSRQFARSDRLRRQLVLWAGFHPMMIQRTEYYDQTDPVHGHFKGLYGNR